MRARRTTSILLRATLVVLGTVVLLLLVLALVLPPLARRKTREALDGMKGAHGDFLDVQVSLFPLRYTITRLKVTRTDAVLKLPSLYAERLEVTLRLLPLLHGVFSGRLDGDRVKVVLEEPEPGPDRPLPSREVLVPVQAVLERGHLTRSEVLYAWVREEGRPTLWVHDIDLTLENAGSRPGLVKEPLVLEGRGTIERKGALWVAILAEPDARRLTFSGKARLDGYDPSQLNAYLGVKEGVTLTPGIYAMRMSFHCDEGRLHGVVDPELSGSELQSKGDVGSALKAFFGKIALGVSGPTEGTKPGGAIAVSDDLTDPKLQLAPRLEKVVENGFSLGLREALKRAAAGKTEASPDRKPTPLKARK